MKYLNDIKIGFLLPFQSLLKILTTPRLMVWSLIPVSLTALAYIQIIGKINLAFKTALPHGLSYLGLSQNHWLGMSLVIMTKIILVMISAFTFSFVSTLIASPFNDFLAEATERQLGIFIVDAPTGFLFKARIILIDVTKTIVTTVMGILAILISWVPALNIIALMTAWLLFCFQFISYPQTRRGVGLVHGARFLIQNFLICVSFGASLSICFAIPFFSILMLPAAVVGGTVLFGMKMESKIAT